MKHPWMVRAREGLAHGLVNMVVMASIRQSDQLATTPTPCHATSVATIPSTLLHGLKPMGRSRAVPIASPPWDPRVGTGQRAHRWDAVVVIDKYRVAQGSEDPPLGPRSSYMASLNGLRVAGPSSQPGIVRRSW